jgi:hypothetical protein
MENFEKIVRVKVLKGSSCFSIFLTRLQSVQIFPLILDCKGTKMYFNSS